MSKLGTQKENFSPFGIELALKKIEGNCQEEKVFKGLIGSQGRL